MVVELKNSRLKKIKLFLKFKVNIHIRMSAYDQLLFFYFSMIKKNPCEYDTFTGSFGIVIYWLEINSRQ